LSQRNRETALDAWNRERTAAGLPPLRMGVGLHYGPVVAGDAIDREDADRRLLEGLTPRGPHALRDRDNPIVLWAE
jgi:class 3 adenylate cyclase